VRHWAQGGETKASNLVTLCSFHHRLVHEDGVNVQVLDDGAFRFVRPDGRVFDEPAPSRGEPFDGTELRRHSPGDLQINRNTAVTRWRGERMDYGLAIEVLLAQARAAQARGAPARSRGNA
jgi:hypothetical protein